MRAQMTHIYHRLHGWYHGLNQQKRLTVNIIAVVGIWVLSGVLLGGGVNEEEAITQPKLAVQSLRVQPSEAQSIQRYVEIYGQTEASQDVNLAAQTSGRVIAIPAVEGDSIEKGDVIVRIDPQEREERVSALKALVNERSKEYNAAQRLSRKGFDSEISRARALAALNQAKADLRRAELEVDFTEVKAPFSGVLERVNVDIGDFVGVGVFGVEGSIARVLDADPVLATGNISQKDRPFVNAEASVPVTLQSGQRYTGQISFLASAAEEASRSFPVEVTLDNLKQQIPIGVSVRIQVPLNEVGAHLVPGSLLSLNDEGTIQIKVLDEQNTVQAHPVEIVREEKEGLWVQGLPPRARLITLGHHYVAEGDAIDASLIQTTESK